MKYSDRQILSFAELIVLSGPELFAYIYNKRGESLVNWFIRLIRDDKSSYHTSHILADISKDSVRGMIITLPATVMKEKSINEAKSIRQNCSGFGTYVVYMIRLIWRLRILFHYPKLKNDEMFIANLAVYDEFRGKGIGSRLLAVAEENANSNGYSKLSLFVEIDNEKAISLYQNQGFKIVSKKVFPKEYNKYHLYGLYKMVKSIS